MLEAVARVVFVVGFIAAVTFIAVTQASQRFSSSLLFASVPTVFEPDGGILENLHPNARQCPALFLFYHASCGHCRRFAPVFANLSIAWARRAPGVLFAAVNCPDFAKICGANDVKGFPTLYAVPPGPPTTPEGALPPTKVFVARDPTGMEKDLTAWLASMQLSQETVDTCDVIRKFLVRKGEVAVHALATKNETPLVPFVHDDTYHAADVATAFFWTMWQEVSMVPPAADARAALVRLLGFVSAALPGLRARVLLNALKSDPAMPVAQWQRVVEEAGVPYSGTPDTPVWTTCRGSAAIYRGYTCGLWLLFHTLLASVPIRQANAALGAIRGYLLAYFHCSECREHFVAYPFDIKPDDPDGTRAILWLWGVHNEVNVRLARTEGQDPLVRKGPFPSAIACPTCMATTPTADGNPQYIEAEVLAYLTSRYRWKASSLVRREAKKEDGPKGERVEQSGVQSPHNGVAVETEGGAVGAPPAPGWMSSPTVAALALPLAVVVVAIALIPRKKKRSGFSLLGTPRPHGRGV